MPGHEERTPSDADRAPASRVGDELQKAADDLGAEAGTLSSEEVADLERDAKGRAEDVQWDQVATAAEGEAAADEHKPSPEQAAQNREDEPPA